MTNVAEPTTWDYDTSVEHLRPKIQQWKTLTVKIARELYVARAELAERKPLKTKGDVTTVTWTGYLRDIGIQRMTAHRWLERYDPETDTLYDKPLKQIEANQRLEERDVTQPSGKLDNAPYSIIYADPPWAYNDRAASTGRWGGAINHYPTMIPAEIAAMEMNGRLVSEYAAEDAVLFLWVTFPMLQDCFQVIESWGFTYKTAGFVWFKTNNDGTPYMGLGNTTRQNVELCLYSKRGRGLERLNAGVSSVVLQKRSQHSAKPPVVRDRITQLFGDVPKLEIFARDVVGGWDYWGNEAPHRGSP